MNLNSLLKDNSGVQATEVNPTLCEHWHDDEDNAPGDESNKLTGPWVDVEQDTRMEETRHVSASNLKHPWLHTPDYYVTTRFGSLQADENIWRDVSML